MFLNNFLNKNILIKYIIFDCNGVFAINSLEENMQIFTEKFGFDIEKLTPVYEKLSHKAILGEVSAIDVCDLLIKEFDIKTTSKELYDVWVDTYVGHPNKEMHVLAEELSKKYQIGLFTDFSDMFSDVSNKLEMNDLFKPENIFVSYKMRLRKPDKKAFQWVIKEVNCKPDEILFIDDCPDNISQAKNLGIQAILFQNVSQLRKDLIILNII